MSARVRRLTPPGRGGVALLAVDGPGAAEVLGRLLRRALPAPGRVAAGLLVDLAGAPVDEVLVARGGPDAFEVGCHGGPAVVARAVEALVAAGAREAPGVDPAGDLACDLAGAPDRPAAEALALLPTARTELGCRVLLAQARGALAAAARALGALDDAAAARAGVEALLASWPLGRALTAPPRVALVGAVNAGKSSLLNALVGQERALVSPEPGTTRDAIEEVADLDGVPARLVDTAGARAADDPVEAAGVARAAEVAARADLRLVVVDAGRAAADPDAALALARAAAPPRLVVLARADLLEPPARAAALAAAADLTPALVSAPVSAKTGEGLEALRARLRAALAGPPLADDAPVLFTPRQQGLAAGAARALARGDLERARACLGALAG